MSECGKLLPNPNHLIVLRKAQKPIKIRSCDLPLPIEFNGKIYKIKETPKHGLQMT